jgi:predicted kinase
MTTSSSSSSSSSSSASSSSSPPTKHEDLISITNSTDVDQLPPISWHAGGGPSSSANANANANAQSNSNSNSNSKSKSSVIATESNPLPHVLPEGDNAAPLEVMGSSAASDKLVIVMVGLPATGKTHIAKRICRFLSFFHDIPSQIFNVGDYRRQLCGAQLPASFYNPSNVNGVAQRKVACDAALADLMEYINFDGVRVAALDATNSTKERRIHIVSTLKKEKNNIKCIFIESICDDEAVSF